MDPWVVLTALLAVAVVVLGWSVRRHAVAARRIRLATGTSADADLAVAVRQLRADADARARDLAAAREATSRLLDIVGPGVLQLGADLHVVEANPAAHALLDRPGGTLLGRTVMEAFLDPAVESTARSALELGAAATEIHPAGPDGLALVVRARRAPTGGVWLLLDDVSELRRLQRIRAEFIDNLSHELRTPLSTVSLLAETLAMDADAAKDRVPVRMRERIAKIEVETGHLVQMVNELLDLSRIEGGGTLQLADGVDLGGLAGDAADRLRLFAERQGVRLRVDVAADLPAVRADPTRIGQVVVNLVHNAVKFSPDGGDVAVRTRAEADEVIVEVEDHGLGIPRTAIDRVFERFYKVDRARQRPEAGGGTGLGLAIARHVVQQHGGRIWVHSVEGEGSTFGFAIPVVPAS